MGNTHYYVYSRYRESDSWNRTPLLDDSKSLMSKFKHMVYAFALDKKYEEYKAIYLYENKTRLVKAELSALPNKNHLILTFDERKNHEIFSNSDEKMTAVDIPLLERQFKNKFKLGAYEVATNEGKYQMIFQRK